MKHIIHSTLKMKKPFLSIVTPTLGKFSDYWLNQYLKVKGDVEFVLVYPRGVNPKKMRDKRVRSFVSKEKGELPQRLLGFFKAKGKYVLALDDDDFLHPDILCLAQDYFKRFPKKWVLRLRVEIIDYRDKKSIMNPWGEISKIEKMEVYKKNNSLYNPKKDLLEIPIAPLENKFNIKFLFWPFEKRKGHHGIHMENFNTKIWRNDLVQDTSLDIAKTKSFFDFLRLKGKSGFDRVFGLFLQAKFYEREKIIGHLMPFPEQIRFIRRPNQLKKRRFHFFSHLLLIKRFPKYGYFWNLSFSQFWSMPIRALYFVLRRLKLARS